MIRHSLIVPGTSATSLIRVKTAQSEEHQNYTIVGKNCFTLIMARIEIY